MTTQYLPIAMVTFTLLAGCSGDGNARTTVPVEVTGQVAGAAPVFLDASWRKVSASGLEFSGQSTALVLTTYADSCARFGAGAQVAGSTLLFIGLADVAADGSAQPSKGPGTYTIVTGTPPSASKSAQAYLERFDAGCLRTTSSQAQAGTISLTRVDDTAIEGSLTLSFDGSDAISGSFGANACGAFDPNSSAFVTCQ